MTRNKGIALIEVLIAISIFVLILIGVSFAYMKSASSGALDKSAFLVVSTINQARSLNLSSKDDSEYGVHFESDKLVIFRGSSYAPGASDQIEVDLSPAVFISGISLGGGSEVVFERLTGETSDEGTVTVSLVSDPSQSIVVSIYATGLSEVN